MIIGILPAMDKHIVRITGWTAGDRLTFFFAGDLFDSP